VLLQTLDEARVGVPVRLHGIPQRFLDHAKRARILEEIGLDARSLARSVIEDLAALDRGDALVDVE
jgi:1-deoxy-D-xylulose-5-phosphate synthase